MTYLDYKIKKIDILLSCYYNMYCRRLVTNIKKNIRYYNKKVLDHYNNPRNVGSLDSSKKSVGTGLVGAPACIHEDTLIGLADGRRYESVKNLYLENKIVPVWSYNIERKNYEIKNARIIKQENKKPMVKVTLDDGSCLICTKDHKFLTRNLEYTECQNVNKSSIIPFKLNKKGFNDIAPTIKKLEILQSLFDCYDLQVEGNNNFAIITKITAETGIILHNCGDVMKIQIEVKDDIIVDAKFKTFGCLAGNVIIATPKGYVKIRSLSIGDIVYAWNGKCTVENEIVEINNKWINYKDLLTFEFEGSCHFKFICSIDHIWWLASDKPIEAENLNIGDELIHITENEIGHNELKVLNKKKVTKKTQIRGLEMDGNNVKLYDLRLKEGANVFFAGRIGTHNCGSAIASSSYGTEYIKGKDISEAYKVHNQVISKHLGLPPVKLHCSMLLEDGIKAAIDNYKKKQN